MFVFKRSPPVLFGLCRFLRKKPSVTALEKGLLSPTQLESLLALLSPEAVVPGYELVDLIGHGAMGIVYQARQIKLDRIVALKLIRLGESKT